VLSKINSTDYNTEWTTPTVPGTAATGDVYGVTTLTDSTSSTSTTTAATPNSVKSAYDLAGTANTTAGTAIPKDTVTAEGDILYASGSATVARLGIGTADQVLGIAAGVPAWTTPSAGGGLTLIATATPSAATSLAFTSIPGTYKHLQLVWFDVFQSSKGPYWGIRLNNNSTAGQYWQRSTGANTANGTATSVGWTNVFAPVGATTTSGTVYLDQAKGTMDIFRYTESAYKFFRVTATSDLTDPMAQLSGIFLGTAAITSLDFVRSSTQTITGKFYLYGVS
jgi:hypothetical protein